MSLLTELLLSFFVAVAVASGGYYYGHKNGVNEQKALDQAQFDTINKERSRQKSDAAALMTKIQQDISAALQANAALNRAIEESDAHFRTQIDALHSQLATRSLRFVVAPAGGRTDRACGASAQGAAASAAIPLAPAVVQLPDPIAVDLRQLTLDADRLLGEYRKCYDWTIRQGQGDTLNAAH